MSRKILIKHADINEGLCSEQRSGWLWLALAQSTIGYLLLLPTLWEAIASEGGADSWLCITVLWQGAGRVLSLLATSFNIGVPSRVIYWPRIIRALGVILSVFLLCRAHIDDPLRVGYALLLVFLSVGTPSCYGSGFLRETLLITLLGASMLFSLGVIRHEWWYCELKGGFCATIASTHVGVIVGLGVLLCILFGSRETSLFVKSIRVLIGTLLLCIATAFLLADLSLNPSWEVTTVDSSVGLLCAIVVVITPYVHAVSLGALKSGRATAALISVGGVVTTAALLSLVLIPTALKFYRVPYFERTQSGQVISAEVEVCDELATLLLTAEDPTFFFHTGIDFVRLRDAVAEVLKKGEYGRGGSTLSMQLAKVYYLDYDKSIVRKLRQVLLGVLIELSYSKASILRAYLRAVPFAPGVVGIESAAQRFFDRPLSHLNREQFLRLVVAIYDPTIDLYGNHPFTGLVGIRARTIETREKIFNRTLLRQWWSLKPQGHKN